MEIGDVFAINKADRAGAEQAAHALRSMIHLGARREGWEPPVCLTVAQDGTGVPELEQLLARHFAHLSAAGLLARRRRKRLAERITALLTTRARAHYHARVSEARRNEILSLVEARALTPAEAARTLYDEAWPHESTRTP